MRTPIILPVLCLFLLCAASCKNDKKVSIIGKWRPVELNVKDMKEEERKAYMETGFVEFTKEGRYISSSSKNTEKGTFIFREKTNMLVTYPVNGRKDSLVLKFTGNKLILSDKDGSVTLQRQ